MINCEKCGKEIEGAVIVRDFSYYHFECCKNPLKDRLADFAYWKYGVGILQDR